VVRWPTGSDHLLHDRPPDREAIIFRVVAVSCFGDVIAGARERPVLTGDPETCCVPVGVGVCRFSGIVTNLFSVHGGGTKR